jgi:hypothetical protein
MGAEPSASQVHCALSHSALEGLSSVSSCAQAVAKACTLKRHCGTRSVATVQSDIDEKIADIGGLHIALRAIQSMREREHSTRRLVLHKCTGRSMQKGTRHRVLHRWVLAL